MDKQEELGILCLSVGEETGFAVILGSEALLAFVPRLRSVPLLLWWHEDCHTGCVPETTCAVCCGT